MKEQQCRADDMTQSARRFSDDANYSRLDRSKTDLRYTERGLGHELWLDGGYVGCRVFSGHVSPIQSMNRSTNQVFRNMTAQVKELTWYCAVALHRNSSSSVICHIWSHGVTCHATRVNVPHL